jgi:hypothetical protein
MLVSYNLACFYSLMGEPDAALDCLEQMSSGTPHVMAEWRSHDPDHCARFPAFRPCSPAPSRRAGIPRPPEPTYGLERPMSSNVCVLPGSDIIPADRYGRLSAGSECCHARQSETCRDHGRRCGRLQPTRQRR